MQSALKRKSTLHKTRPALGPHVIWLTLILMTSAFVLGDTAIVAWYANVLSTAEAGAYGFAFALISIGVLVTAGNFERLSRV